MAGLHGPPQEVGWTLPDGRRAPHAPALWPFGTVNPTDPLTPMPEPRHAPPGPRHAAYPTDAEPAPF